MEDKLSEINYKGKCESCSSFSLICITMHGSENVKFMLSLFPIFSFLLHISFSF